MKRTNTQPLKDVLEQYVEALKKLNPKFEEAEVINAWMQMVPKGVANSISNVYFKDRELHVFFNSSVYRYEMSLIKEHLIKHLNQVLHGQVVMDIQFR